MSHYEETPLRAVYVISVAAELAGMHPQTLRGYERKGLLEPERTVGGSRRYSDIDIARLRRIHELVAQGLNIEGIRRVVELEDQVAGLQVEIEQLRSAMHAAAEAAARSGASAASVWKSEQEER